MDNYINQRKDHWNRIGKQVRRSSGPSRYYHRRLEEVYRLMIPSGQRVLELGCGEGDLLAAVSPAVGVGVDFSEEKLKKAKEKHPALSFVLADAHALELEQTFDFIIISDLLNDAWDVQKIFNQMKCLVQPGTRVILNTYSRLWELPLWVGQSLNLADPVLQQNWLTVEDIENLLGLEDFEVIRTWQEVLWPMRIPLLDGFLNKFLVKIAPFNLFALTNFMIARPRPKAEESKGDQPSVSVIIPVRNEEGHVPQYFARVPQMGASTELVFVEGHSKDNTYQAVEEAIAAHPDHRASLYRQTGKGKGDAVRLGFEKAQGDILMILDGDLTVPPEDLPLFYQALAGNKGEFINGVRLVYPMEEGAMRFLNLVGNKFFSLAFSWLLGQPIKDTLCGTKVLWKRDYQKIAANRSYFGDFDPFGDFDLIFGAAKLNLKIVDLPIRYRERQYGETNIDRWRHGWLLLRMVVYAARRLKFV